MDNNNNLHKTNKKTKQTLPEKKLLQALEPFTDKKSLQQLHKKNLQITKKAIKESVTEDQLIIQTIANINELDKTINLHTKRLREWYSLYYPELSNSMENHEHFTKLTLKQRKHSEMGADLKSFHVKEMQLLSKTILNIIELRKQHEEYLTKVMRSYCPNLLELAGPTIGADLLEHGKSLKRLAVFPASTIQLLGAEKALFRHLKTGARSPKYGVIFAHQLIQKAQRKDRGKAARMLADKLSLCCRLDYFKGEFKAKEYRKELERKLK